MIVLYSCIFLIFTLTVSMVFSQNQSTKTSLKGFGPVACILNGDFDMDCKLETVLCEHLPSDCSSYLWFGAKVDFNYRVRDLYGPNNDVFFQKLLKCAKIPVYLIYGYWSWTEWSTVLACSGADGKNVQDEVLGLTAYLNSHKNITGILLNNLNVLPGRPTIEDLTPNLKSYITSLRQLLPDLEIAITLYADELLLHYEDPKVDWINFKELIDVLDFVHIDYQYFNPDCTKELVHGLYPITGNAKFTIEKVQVFLDKAGIPKEKLYFRFETHPTTDKGDASHCTVTYPKMCKNPKNVANWCADNTSSFYEKGVFAQKHGSGFSVAYVDLDDVHCDCQCGRSFPAFHAILDGFNGAPMPQSCPLFDRC